MKSVESEKDGTDNLPLDKKEDPLAKVVTDDDLAAALHSRYAAGTISGADHEWLSNYHKGKAGGGKPPSEVEDDDDDPYSQLGE